MAALFEQDDLQQSDALKASGLLDPVNTHEKKSPTTETSLRVPAFGSESYHFEKTELSESPLAPEMPIESDESKALVVYKPQNPSSSLLAGIQYYASTAWSYAEPALNKGVTTAIALSPYVSAAAVLWYGAPTCAVLTRAAIDRGMLVAVPNMWSQPFAYMNFVAFREHAVAASYNYGPRVVSTLTVAVPAAAKMTYNAVETTLNTGVAVTKTVGNALLSLASATTSPFFSKAPEKQSQTSSRAPTSFSPYFEAVKSTKPAGDLDRELSVISSTTPKPAI